LYVSHSLQYFLNNKLLHLHMAYKCLLYCDNTVIKQFNSILNIKIESIIILNILMFFGVENILQNVKLELFDLLFIRIYIH